MMGVNSCVSVRARGACHCPACPRGSSVQMPPQTLVLPPMALGQETTPVKDKKGSKMKVLKKIKKKIGLAPRTTCSGGAPNNLPPLAFHAVHGDNVRVSRDGSTARRVESFCKGVAFSARPVRVNEKVCVRFVEISTNWSGVLRFGFTTHDPTSLAHCLPKYACPDLTNKPGNWAKALAERYCENDNMLFYYFNSAGDVHFGINGEERGVFFSGVDTRSPLWSLVDVYGNCTAIQYVDPRTPATRPPIPALSDAEDRLAESMRSLAVTDSLPPTRFQSQSVAPLTLHRTKGRNVLTQCERGIAARVESEFCQGYVFTGRPMRPGQTLVVQILGTEPAYAGSLAIGLTSCDPATLRPCDLPDDAEQLLDRQEYWVVRRDAANGLRRGDELSVTLTLEGEVRVSRNGAAMATVMHVDHSLRLWAFVDVYGATQRVRLLSTAAAAAPVRVLGGPVLVVSLPPQPHQQPCVASAHYIEPMQSSSQLCLANVPMTQYNQLPPQCSQLPPQCSQLPPQCNQINQLPPQCNQLPPQCNPLNQLPPQCNPLNQLPPQCNPTPSQYQRRSDVQCSTNQNNQNEQITPNMAAASSHMLPLYAVDTSNLTGTECTICYENPIDSVLYMCGHMCMCYRCAVQQWRGKGGGHCPLCRAQIKDVIRTYKS